jgi:23S rRNA (adenine2030-N6)-methyltransferase
MNYRHVFHAGNFADLFKHAVLLDLLAALRAEPGAFTAIDTHAGAGVYDLEGEAARRTGEGRAAYRLAAQADAPAVFSPLVAAIGELNDGPDLRLYPGSPWLIGRALRAHDRGVACEARPDDAALLRAALARFRRVEVLAGDGWRLAERTAPGVGRLLVLIDPPFEAPDDGARAAALTARILSRNAAASVAVWAPIKDLAGFDALSGDIEDAASGRPVLVQEVRLRPLDDPLRLNGCAMIIANPPPGLDSRARGAAEWIERTLGGG